MAPQLRGKSSATGSTTSFDLGVPAAMQAGDLLVVYGVWFYSTTTVATTVPSGWTKVVDMSYGYHRWFVAVSTTATPGSSHTFTKANTDGYLAVMSAWHNITGTYSAYHNAGNVSSGNYARVTYSSTSSPVAGANDLLLYGFFCNGTDDTGYSGFSGTRTQIDQFYRHTPDTTAFPPGFEQWSNLVISVQSETGTLTTGTREMQTNFSGTGAYGSGVVLVIYGLPDTLELCATVDTFSRTVSGGWGPSWDASTYAQDWYFSVDGNRGVIHDYDDGGGNFQPAVWLPAVCPDARHSIDIQWPSLPSNMTHIMGYTIFDRVQASGRAYIAHVSPTNTSGNIGFGIYRNFLGTLSTRIAFVTIPAIVTATWYTLHMQCVGTSPTQIQAWLTSSTGSVLATVTVSDSDALWQSYGKIGVGRDFQGTASTIPASFDNYRICCPVAGGWRLQVI